MFISIEGQDGSGKTTLVKNLYSALSGKYKVFCTKEPGGTGIGMKIRDILSGESYEEKTDPYTELLLMLADRHQHIATMKKASQQWDVILCDRYYDSTIAYQEYGNNLAIVEEIPTYLLHGNFIPNLTFYLRVSYETARRRMVARGEKLFHFEKMGKCFYEKVARGYESQANLCPWRIKTINGEQDSYAVLSDCLNYIK